MKNQCIENPFRIEYDKFFGNLRFDKNNSKNGLKKLDATRCSAIPLSMLQYIKKENSKKEDKEEGRHALLKNEISSARKTR